MNIHAFTWWAAFQPGDRDLSPFCLSVPQDCGPTLVPPVRTATGGGTGSGPHHHLRTLLENLFSEASDQGSATPASGLLPPLASWCWTPAEAHRHQENLPRTLMLSPALTPARSSDPFLPPCFCSRPFPLPGMPCLLFQGFSKSRDSGLRVSSKLEDYCER